MAITRSGKNKTRAEPKTNTQAFFCDTSGWDTISTTGYVPLSKNAEIMSGVQKIADLVSSMTIHLLENSDKGDIKVRDGLSRKIDINPNQYTTRKTFISSIVRTLLLEGDGNSIVKPVTEDGFIQDLVPIAGSQVTFVTNGYGYKINIGGVQYDPTDLIHIAINADPNYYWKGSGYKTTLRDVAENLNQANKTKKGFMESKWKPSIIIKVDATVEEFSSREGREKVLEDYVSTAKAGEPWLLPGEQFDIKEVRPLSLNDIAIHESVRLDKRTVAAILNVPSFVVGEGEYKELEWNNFISTRIRPICQAIEQEFTKKLLLSPNRYFKFSMRSLYSYDIKTLSEVGANMYTRGIMTGNEVRDWLGLGMKEGLDELIILENYIPQGMIGEQKKLSGGGEAVE